ncbi:MAG TPA: hypothetical protein VFW33_04380 [Gemmataceae bacterium]|nr:hypothetical protein [Gemmataceae bacterium]
MADLDPCLSLPQRAKLKELWEALGAAGYQFCRWPENRERFQLFIDEAMLVLQPGGEVPLATRPPFPTADYCLLFCFGVRWEGETTLQPQQWRILQWLLSQAEFPCLPDGLEDVIQPANGSGPRAYRTG